MPPDMHRIILRVAVSHGMTVSDLTGDSRTRRVAYSRHEAMWACRSERKPDGSARWSYPKIAQAFGDRDHTTVIHGVKAHARRLQPLPPGRA